MEDLNLPIIKIAGFKEKQLTMDDYLRFVSNNLKTFAGSNPTKRSKKASFVATRFVLK